MQWRHRRVLESQTERNRTEHNKKSREDPKNNSDVVSKVARIYKKCGIWDYSNFSRPLYQVSWLLRVRVCPVKGKYTSEWLSTNFKGRKEWDMPSSYAAAEKCDLLCEMCLFKSFPLPTWVHRIIAIKENKICSFVVVPKKLVLVRVLHTPSKLQTYTLLTAHQFSLLEGDATRSISHHIKLKELKELKRTKERKGERQSLPSSFISLFEVLAFTCSPRIPSSSKFCISRFYSLHSFCTSESQRIGSVVQSASFLTQVLTHLFLPFSATTHIREISSYPYTRNIKLHTY